MSGYVDPRGMYYRPDQPYLAYEPGHAVRFFRSQRSWNGEREVEDQYKSSQQWAGWAAARPQPNRVPTLLDRRGDVWPTVRYNLPGGPTQPKQLLQQGTVPPTFPAGDYRIYEGASRYALPPQPQALTGLGECCPPQSMADAVASALKRILPELATSIGVQTARASAMQTHARPSNIDPPIRAFEFAEAPLVPVAVTDTVFLLVVEHLVPVGAIAVANLIEVQAESPAALMDTEVQIRVGGLPVPRYNSMNAPDLGSPGVPATINIKAVEQQRIQVFARARTIGAIHNLTAVLRGWDSLPSLMTNLDAIAGWRGQ